MADPDAYMSFLIRLWQEEKEPGVPESIDDWQGEIEHIQTGQRWTFDSLEALLEFVRQQTEDPSD